MAWLPGVSTLSLEDLYRAGNSAISGKAIKQLVRNNTDIRVGYTQQNYRGGDIITPQTVALARVNQRNTIEKQNVASTPTLQIGDLVDRGFNG